MFQNKIITSILISNFIFLLLMPACASVENSDWWDENWDFRQELIVPIDTSSEHAKYQPIDIHIKFDSSCWAENEQTHSIRIVFQENGYISELESQIYDINYSDENHIESCSLVFLIPEAANGNEKYYVYYNEQVTPAPNYLDHVDVEESYYYFAPIPGFPFESHYYKITEDGYVVYGVALEGEFLGVSTSQQVNIFSEKTKEVTTPTDGDAYASFDYFYYYGKEIDDFGSTIQTLVSKEIFIDGNLMVEFGIISGTSKEDFQTTATYKYYYCPSENRRICAHVKHEALKESRVIDIYPNSESCGNIAGLQIGIMKSPSVKELNFGRMFPYMHVYSEKDMILEYELDPDPEYTPEGITILNTDDDVDLGVKPWASFDEGGSGEAHALIFGSNNVVKSGTNERDGIQIKAIEVAGPGLLGLESDAISFYFSRNSYEKGSANDLEIPKDFIVEFDAEFFSTKNGGYEKVDSEASIFQALLENRPSQQGKASGVMDEGGTNKLTAFIHLAPSAPMGTFLSLLTGMNISYISAELYHDGEFILTDIGGRLPFGSFPSFEDTKPLEKIKLGFNIFDWKNFSFRKKVGFKNLESGTYLVKIYKENPTFGNDRKYIGFKIVDVKEDTKISIFCRPEGTAHVSVFDQHEKGVEDVYVRLLYDDTIIADDATSPNGFVEIDVPCSLTNTYELNLLYKGFIIHEEPVKLKYIRSNIPLKKTIDIKLYDLQIKLEDTWGLTIDYSLNPVLTSNEMDEQIWIPGEYVSDGWYLFENLYPGTYHLDVQHKSFLLDEDIIVDNSKEIALVFDAVYVVEITTLDSRGMLLKDTTIVLERDGENIEKKCDEEGVTVFSIPAGVYTLTVYHDNEIIGKRKINIISDRSYEIVTNKEPIFPQIIITITIAFSVIAALLFIRKKDHVSLLKICSIGLALLSIVLPWWMLTSSSSSSTVETIQNMYLIPGNLIKFTTTPSVIVGEVASASLPELFSDIIMLFSVIIFIGCLLVMIHLIVEKTYKRISSGALYGGTVLISATVLLFYIVFNELTKVGIGSFIGSGDIGINIPGESSDIIASSTWGPTIGFILCVVSMILLIISSYLHIKKRLIGRQKTIKKTNKKNISKILKRFMPIIGILLLAYLILSIGTDEIASTFLKISPVYILIAASLTIPRVLIRNYAWQLILRKQKINVSFFKSLKIFLIGYFYGSITPGYIGQFMRIPYLKDETGEPVGKLFVNSIVEEAVHTMSLYIMMIVGAFFIVDKIPEALPIACIVLFITILIYGFFIKKERGEKTFHFLITFLIPKKFKPYFTNFVDTFYNDFPDVKSLVLPFVVVIPTWIIIYSQIYILGLSLDIEVPYLTFLLLYSIANMVAFIPITSAGLGTREATLIFLFSFFGVSPEKALVLSLAGHLLTDVLTGFYGFILSVTESRNNRKDLSELDSMFDQMKQ